MIKRLTVILFFSLSAVLHAAGGWRKVSDLKYSILETEFNGTQLLIEYNLDDTGINKSTPVWIFIRYSTDSGKLWQRVPEHCLTGGFGVVSSAGHQQVSWWGVDQMAALPEQNIDLKVRALALARVPGGKFVMKSTPGDGYDGDRIGNVVDYLPEYCMALHETTIGMYVDYLNETGSRGAGWTAEMADPSLCGIVREAEAPSFVYRALEGKEENPVAFVSWYDAASFLAWCGLKLPTEAQWEKAWRGGRFLDGDTAAALENPNPERNYPWGDQPPDEGGIYRCNGRGEADGYSRTAPVGSFSGFTSPYGIFDMAGNVAEWTLDWYTTNYHEGLDGIRMNRGGSWRSLSFGLDAISGATSLPANKSAIMGFRAVTPSLPEK